MDDYAGAKRNIYRWQTAEDTVVLNADDPLVLSFAEDAPGRVRWFSLERTGLEGAWLEGDSLLWNDSDGRQSCPAGLLRMPGRHNQANALAAIALASSAGCPAEAIIAGLSGFEGVPDRLELVRELAGVRYYNDTTATSPAGTIAALQAFEADRGRIVLIAGGADKKLEFEPLAEALNRAEQSGRLREIILLDGTATPRLVEALQRAGCGRDFGEPFSDFEKAVRAASQEARPGDLVLLSPGCASFGMFVHEFDRGTQFRALVNSL